MDIEQIIKSQSPEIYRKIKKAAQDSDNETAFRIAISKIISDFAEKAGLTLSPKEEYTLVTGRADSVYSRFIIEYKNPGVLKKSNKYLPNQKAIEKLEGYIRGLHEKEREKLERLAGVITDGNWYIFVRYREKQWRADPPLPVTKDSAELFLRYLSSLAIELPLTPEKLVEFFGEKTTIAQKNVSTFYKILVEKDDRKSKVLFEQWQTQFSEVCGYKENSTKFDIEKLAINYGVLSPKIDPLRLFFSIHTYYATFIKLFALQIASFYASPRIRLGEGLRQISSYGSEELLKHLKELERGGIFKHFGINNFLEGDFFGWYLSVWEKELDDGIRAIISKLADFSLITLDVDPDETRDLLKRLYQNLMPKELRHNLGEYYTPDWLAERLLNQLEGGEFEGNLNKRLLDPACGSGTFLVLTIQKMRQFALEKMIPEDIALEKILENVVGFDLNPLAVISARTNYLLALGDLLKYAQGEINIPVYLADSILTPSPGTELFDQKIRSFTTTVGTFAIPESLVSAQYVDTLANLLEEAVEMKLTPTEFRKKLIRELPILESDEKDIQVVEKLYSQLLEFEKKGINGIWARIIKNAFAPLFKGQFDYVAGNPPWVNWENLPEEYRKELIPLNQDKYRLFQLKGNRARHGGTKIDISTLMFYVSVDKYLKPKGKLGFVITQTVYKTTASSGFRKFKLTISEPIGVTFVDDMSSLKPFEGATNKTSVIIVEKGRKTDYPVPYSYWRKKSKRAYIPIDLSLPEVIKLTRRSQWVAKPIISHELTSPWITGRPKAIEAVHQCIGKSSYYAKPGTCGWANGIYCLEIVGRRPDGLLVIKNVREDLKREVESLEAPIEKDFIFPLLRGKDVKKWRFKTEHYLLVTQNPEQFSKAYPEKKLKINFPKTHSYYNQFKDILANRVGYKKYFDVSKDPFYSVYNVGDYTFSKYKVCWTRVSTDINACVVSPVDDKYLGEKLVIPIETIVFVPFDNESEAHYFCSLINSSPARYVIVSYSSKGTGSFGSPHILNYVKIPRYNSEDKTHKMLSKSSVLAHKIVKENTLQKLAEVENAIDNLSTELWGLSKIELKDIQDSLEDLTA